MINWGHTLASGLFGRLQVFVALNCSHRSAYARLEDRMHALRAGYQMHVPKPVEWAELVAVAASLAKRNV